MHYNFCRIHKSPCVTHATSAGVTDRVWDMTDVAALITAYEAPIAKRGPYKKKAHDYPNRRRANLSWRFARRMSSRFAYDE